MLSQESGREVLCRLRTLLGLSHDQLGRAFGVAGEAVECWEQGIRPIPNEQLLDLSQADSALSRLLAIFQADRLRQVVQREADLFGGEAALDWILRGRIADVAGRYEAATTYDLEGVVVPPPLGGRAVGSGGGQVGGFS